MKSKWPVVAESALDGIECRVWLKNSEEFFNILESYDEVIKMLA